MNLGDFEDKIQRELAWRKKELSDLRALVAGADEILGHLFRAGQVLMCSHWEGFLKRSVQLYIDYIFSQQVKLKELVPAVISIALYKDVMKAGQNKYPGSELHHIKLARRILLSWDSVVNIPSWDVHTEGNPTSEVLQRVLASVGVSETMKMEMAAWSATRVFIDEQLLKDRNRVAHGEKFPVPRAALLERLERLLLLLNTLSDLLLEAAENESYKS